MTDTPRWEFIAWSASSEHDWTLWHIIGTDAQATLCGRDPGPRVRRDRRTETQLRHLCQACLHALARQAVTT